MWEYDILVKKVSTVGHSQPVLFKNLERRPSLIWVSSIVPNQTLDAATWLDTTDELRQLGWQVTLLADGPRELTAVRGIEVRCLPRPNIYLLGRLIYHLYVLWIVLRQWWRTDVVLFDQLSAPWLLLPLRTLRLLTGRKRPLLIMDTRDLDDPAPDSWRIRLRRWFFRGIVFSMANHLTDGQTAITPRMGDLVGIPKAQLLGYWPSGVDPEIFAQPKIARRWPAVGEPIRLIYVGILLPKRNLLPLSKAVVRANREGMHFSLALYGSGQHQQELAAFAATSDGSVQVLEPVAHHEIPTLLGEAHVGVTSLPAPDDIKYQASSPIKLFEYLAAGMPVLSVRNVCHTEVVGDGSYAFWADVPTEEAILCALRTLWAERSQLSKLGEEAALASPLWSWQAAAQKLSDALLLGLQQHNAFATQKRVKV